MKTKSNIKMQGAMPVGSGDLLGVGLTSKESESFVRRFNDPDTAKTVRETYREVGVGVYESNAPPLSDFHQKLMGLIKGTFYKLGTFCHRHGFALGEKVAFKLVYHLRSFVWSLHDKRVLRDGLLTPNEKS
jgi:hypothetical protein